MNILKIPNPILSQKAVEVTDFEGAKLLADGMLSTAEQEGLLGLAANQVGSLLRIIVIDLTHGLAEHRDFISMINPVVKPIKELGRSWAFESCASIPNVAYMVERWNRVNVEYQNSKGENCSLTLSPANSRSVQHEVDHLNGITLDKKKGIVTGKQKVIS